MENSNLPAHLRARQGPNPNQPKRYDGQNGNPLYDPTAGGHYGASASIAFSGHAPDPAIFTGAWGNVNQGLSGQFANTLNTYWQQQVAKLETDDHDYKLHQLPLARIKKVMKADPEVKMISAEAPILFAKGCDIFITELTMRAWIHAEENKRRTLQRSDIASALAKSDMFDFLIDIVPREEATAHKPRGGQSSQANQSSSAAPVPQANVQQQAVEHPSSHQMPPPGYGMGQHMPPEQDFRQQPGMFAGPVQSDPSAAYGQAPPQMFDQSMYGYGMQPQTQMYPVGQRAPDPTGAGDPNQYRPHDPEGDADAEGEREDYGP